jgi:hypothetical protein
VFQADFNVNRVCANWSELSWSTTGCGIIPFNPPPSDGLALYLLPPINILIPNPGIWPTRSPKPPVDHPDFPVADPEKVPTLDIYIIQ